MDDEMTDDEEGGHKNGSIDVWRKRPPPACSVFARNSGEKLNVRRESHWHFHRGGGRLGSFTNYVSTILDLMASCG